MFLPCSFWLVDALLMQSHDDDARVLFERLLSVSNDLGLLSEEYDPAEKRQLGNFPRRSRTSASSTAPTTSRTTEGPIDQRRRRAVRIGSAMTEVMGARSAQR